MESHVNMSKAFGSLLPLNQLNSLVGTGRTSALGNAVQKFEAFFIQSMLKTMRSASLSTGLLDSDKSDFYREWHDQQLANDLASKETFAVAKLLRQQFTDDSKSSLPNDSLNSDPLFKRSPFSVPTEHVMNKDSKVSVVASLAPTSREKADPIKTTLKQLVTKKLSKNSGVSRNSGNSTPDQFVQQIYPHAVRAASKLNTSADVLVAIAALETGWGLHTPKAHSGQDSFNYFGIKARNWDGLEVTNVTQEFDGEKMITIEDDFRVYETPADSFNDFAEFLLSNPRYQDAINSSSNDKAFIAELQNAGYATDPNYAKKLHSIMDGSILRNAIQSLQEIDSTENVVSNFKSESHIN